MIKHKFSFYIFSFLFFLCANFTSGESQKKQPINVEQEIEEALSEKYLEQFKIKDLYFDKGLNQYVFSASPLNENAIVLRGITTN